MDLLVKIAAVYGSGCVVNFIVSLLLLHRDGNKPNLERGFFFPFLIIGSWLSWVVLLGTAADLIELRKER